MDKSIETIQKIFNQTNDKDILIFYEFPEVVGKIETVKNRTEKLHREMRGHCERHWMVWTQREQDKIFARKFGEVQPQYTIKGQPLSWEQARQQCFNQARETVNARIQQRHETIDRICQNMQTRLTQQARHDFEVGGIARKWLEREVTFIRQHDNAKRIELSRDFDQNKQRYVQEARQSGSERPERDAYHRYKSKLEELSSQKEHNLRQAHEKYGFNFESERHQLTRNFNMNM